MASFQKSNIENRADKLYKRRSFKFLIREMVSNAIQATIIRQSKEKNTKYSPTVNIKIETNDIQTRIIIEDNGEGFTKFNQSYFEVLDSRNQEKEKYNFHPLGQGRLALINYADNSHYESIYLDDDGKPKINKFDYPKSETGSLFQIGYETEEIASNSESKTTLTISIKNSQKFSRSKTFFKKYNDIETLENWFISTFFPFFIENESLNLSINLNEQEKIINKSNINAKIKPISFDINFSDESDTAYEFKLWLVETERKTSSLHKIICFARNLKAQLSEGKLEYDITLPVNYDWYLTSKFFDDRVNLIGEQIEIPSEKISDIQEKLYSELDDYFSNEISANKNKNKETIRVVKTKYPSLSLFVDSKILNSRRELTHAEILQSAIEKKGAAEKQYWIKQDENEETNKLLNSSLHIYVDHRRRVLEQLEELIRRYDSEGEEKREPEKKVHNLFMRQGETFDRQVKNINHLHNLWIIDNKFTTFSNHKASSSKQGQKASDIYLWSDDDPKRKRINEILILELKSTTKAHNAGDKNEGMINQVRNYAGDIYKEPEKYFNRSINPSRVLYTGIILARKTDITREVNSQAASLTKFPFLEYSYYFDASFTPYPNEPQVNPKKIRIELYSYEDILELSRSRNNVFFQLLNGEFRVENNN